jgi:transcriptional antiterminator NusG
MNQQNNVYWYVLFVYTNQEEKVKLIIEKELGNRINAIVPKREIKERKAGKFRRVRKVLFPGYVFLEGVIDVDLYYRIKKIPHIIKLLRTDEDIQRVDEKEKEVIKNLIDNKENIIGIPTVYKKNDKVIVVSGPLVGFEGQIAKIDARKGRAKVRLFLMNEERIVHLGIELVDKL